MKSNIIITGIICLTLLEAWALYQGIDGALFTLIIAVIAAAIGVAIPTPRFMKGGNDNGRKQR